MRWRTNNSWRQVSILCVSLRSFFSALMFLSNAKMQRALRKRRGRTALRISAVLFLCAYVSFKRRDAESAKKTQRKNSSAYLCDLFSLRLCFFQTQRCRERWENAEEEQHCVSLRSSFSALMFLSNAKMQRALRKRREEQKLCVTLLSSFSALMFF